MCGRIAWVWDAATGELVEKYVDPELIDEEVLRVMEKDVARAGQRAKKAAVPRALWPVWKA